MGNSLGQYGTVNMHGHAVYPFYPQVDLEVDISCHLSEDMLDEGFYKCECAAGEVNTIQNPSFIPNRPGFLYAIHGTSWDSALEIMKQGRLNPSDKGMYGPGVYMCGTKGSIKKAAWFAMRRKLSEFTENRAPRDDGCLMVCRIHLPASQFKNVTNLKWNTSGEFLTAMSPDPSAVALLGTANTGYKDPALNAVPEMVVRDAGLIQVLGFTVFARTNAIAQDNYERYNSYDPDTFEFSVSRAQYFGYLC